MSTVPGTARAAEDYAVGALRAGHRTDQNLIAALTTLAAISHSEHQPKHLMDQFVRLIRKTLSVDYVCILESVRDDEVLLMQAGAGFRDDLIGRAVLGRELKSQAGYTLLRKAPVVLEDADSADLPYGISSFLAQAGVKSGVTVPVPPDRALYGVLGVFGKEARVYSQQEVAFLTQAAHYLAGLIVRQKEVLHRKKAQQWLRVMEEATLRSISATSRSTTLQGFAKLLSSPRDGISDLCFIDLEAHDGNTIVREAAASGGVLLANGPDARPLLYPPDPGCPHGTPAVLDTGQPHTIATVEREHLECLARDEAHLKAFVDLGALSYMCLPIKRHRHTLGALVLISCTEAFTREDERHAGRLAYLIGMAIEAIQARMERLSDAREKVDEYFAAPNKQQSSSPQTPLETPRGARPTHHSKRPSTILLSEQRKNILNLLAEGKSPKQIASLLTISPSTVYNTEAKLRHIFGATDRASLIRNAYKEGCLDDSV